MRIEQVDAQIWNRDPDDTAGIRFDIEPRDDLPRNVNAGFGDAVHVDQHRTLIAMTFNPAAEALQIESLTPEDDKAQRGGFRWRNVLRFDQLAKCRWRLIEYGDLFSSQQIEKFTWVAAGQIRDHHEASAVGERTPELPHRKIKGKRVK